jgi:hypothetical protein
MQIKCFGCGGALKQAYPEFKNPPEEASWHDAGVHLFVVGYGSRYDTDKFVIGICDNCIEKGVLEERLIPKDKDKDKDGPTLPDPNLA